MLVLYSVQPISNSYQSIVDISDKRTRGERGVCAYRQWAVLSVNLEVALFGIEVRLFTACLLSTKSVMGTT